MSLEIINLGLPKSGTTTLKRALTEAGYSVADHRVKSLEDKTNPADRVFVGALMYEGLYKYGDPAALFKGVQALSEISSIYGGHSIWPQCDHAMLLALRKLHPELRFVATRRDTEALAHSIMRWSNLGTQRIPRSTVPGLPPGYGHEIDEQMIWIDGHYEALAHWFRDDPLYLELDVAAPDAAMQLERFLGREIPWWGQANINPKDRETDLRPAPPKEPL
ncbi:sulfotransferase [Phaeobacter sp. B1627]|uniref:sulfotransferase n=1 Tax=Phaeobacter sp. B1627 TaxID=2583809 RepID=UPI00111B5172|nr:sulfotransferase [Phaeobacter sp. B1627]TNJ42772.1 sulfotransferase family protein [Phaeobacter sp. B1627]